MDAVFVPGATRADLFAALVPEGTAPEAAAAFHQQFEFAIDRAYLIEFVSGPLALPHAAPAKDRKPEAPAPDAAASASEEPAPAEPSASGQPVPEEPAAEAPAPEQPVPEESEAGAPQPEAPAPGTSASETETPAPQAEPPSE